MYYMTGCGETNKTPLETADVNAANWQYPQGRNGSSGSWVSIETLSIGADDALKTPRERM
jgi:hypothetical protein